MVPAERQFAPPPPPPPPSWQLEDHRLPHGSRTINPAARRTITREYVYYAPRPPAPSFSWRARETGSEAWHRAFFLPPLRPSRLNPNASPFTLAVLPAGVFLPDVAVVVGISGAGYLSHTSHVLA